ncbi:MAG TPA: lytic murein transglycosylase B [Xanthomonadales bacterium]|nr:lytic murein transglycosylase B [Xanthomonadales bacterium]
MIQKSSLASTLLENPGALRTHPLLLRLAGLCLVASLSSSCFAKPPPGPPAGLEDFAKKAAAEHQLDEQAVLELLQQAEFKQSIVDAISRPAEGKPWYDYRPIFLTEKRINEGVAFWKDNSERIARAAERYQVDPQYIVAIIGVETFYGRITGNYRVLDALATLSFYYPDTGNDRSAFFSSELMNFIVLGQEESLPLDEVTGSYAGAMGMGQFMPSSYRAYAVDLDGDGRRDLWSSLDDIIGSVANYLHVHGWVYGDPVVMKATKSADADMSLVADRDYKVKHTVADLAKGGFTADGADPAAMATVTGLEEKAGEDYWLTYKNFYVITRYNRSPLYAMAVYELSEEIRKGMQN